MAPWTLRQIWAAAVHVADNALPVPREVLVDLSTSIRLRWLATQCLPPDVGHTHFLDLLRAVRAKLAPLVPTATPRPTATRCPTATRRSTATPSSSSVSNAFATLSLDDDDDDNDDDDDDEAMPPFDTAAFVPPVDAAPDEVARAASLAQMEADQFRVACFVMDMDGLMGDVKAVWAAFKQGTTTLVAATAVTNHCVRTVEVLANELAIEYPYFTTLDDIGVVICSGDSDAYLPSTSASENAPWRSAVNLDWTAHLQSLLELHGALVTMAHWDGPGTVPLVLSVDLHEAPVASSHDPRRRVLSRLFDPLCLYQHQPEASDAFIPYLAHLKAFAETQVPSIPFLFATECLLASVVAVEGPPSDKRTCATVASYTLASLKQIYRGMLRSQERPHPLLVPESTRRVMKAWTFWLRHTLAKIVKKDAHAWLSPWMAGQLLLAAIMCVQVDAGSRILDDIWQATSMLHLYNALRVVGLMDAVPELDALRGVVERGQLVGFPSMPGRFLVSMLLALGCQPQYARPVLAGVLYGDFQSHLQLHAAKTHRAPVLETTARPRKVPAPTPQQLSRAYRLTTYAEKPTNLVDLQLSMDMEWHSSFLRLDRWVISTVFCELWGALIKKFAVELAPNAEPDALASAFAMLQCCDESPEAPSLALAANVILEHVPLFRDTSLAMGP